MANETIYPYGVGGQTPSGVGLNAGTFGDAYDLARKNNYIFGWFLQDYDEDGNQINKMIWHKGNLEFVDAIGASIDGVKNGVTVNVSDACDMTLNGKTFALSAGENNISFDDIGADNAPNNSWSFYESGSDTVNKTYLTEIDFGGFRFNMVSNNYPTGYTNLKKIKRCVFRLNGWWYSDYFSNCGNVEELEISGYINTSRMQGFLDGMTKLTKADLSGLQMILTDYFYCFSQVNRLAALDISGFDTSQITSENTAASYLFKNGGSALKKLTIGNLSNEKCQLHQGFTNVTGCTLICTTSTPPKLRNCAFVNGVAQDEYASTYDWIAGHFTAIYVPHDAVGTYRNNVYVENGTVGNTGWSKYANIIYDIEDYAG